MEVCAIAVQNTLERLFPEEPQAVLDAAKRTLTAPKTQSFEEEEEGEGGEGSGEGKEEEAEVEEDDEFTTKALAGKINANDRTLVR